MTPLHNELLELAWTQFWQVTVVAAAVGVLTPLACRRRPHLAYVLWMLVLLKCLTPPLWSSPAGLFSLAQWRPAEAEQSPPSAVGSDATTRAAPLPPSVPDLDAAATPTTWPSDAVGPDVLPAAHSTEKMASRLPVSWASVLFVLWAAGALGLACLAVVRYWTFARLLTREAVPAGPPLESLAADVSRRLGLRRRVRVRVASRPVGPAVFGLWRPTIVLPESLLHDKSPQQIEPILAHELVHVRRGDPVWGVLQVAAGICWWFHPLIWWANREAWRERERCCDEEVVAGLAYKPAAYARCLLDVLESERAGRPVLALPAVRSALLTRKRVEEIMTRANSFHRRTPGWCWAVLLATAAVVLPGRALVANPDAAVVDPDRTTTTTTSGDTAASHRSDPPSPSRVQTIVSGRIVGSDQKPIAGAEVALLGWPWIARLGEMQRLETLGTTRSDAQGRFQFTAQRLSSAAFFRAHVLAAARGYAPQAEEVGLDLPQSETTICLSPEQILRGRVVTPDGKPAANARVVVLWRWATSVERPPQRNWPQPAITDAEGRFVLRGVNTDQGAYVRVADDRFASWNFHVGRPGAAMTAAETRRKHPFVFVGADFVAQKAPADEVTLAPPPAQILEGRVVHEDTRKPVPLAPLTVHTSATKYGSMGATTGQADARGQFLLNPHPGKYFQITAYPPAGQPYLIRRRKVTSPLGTVRQTVEIALPRGVLVRGKVTESPSGRPVEGASVQYHPQSRNPHVTDEIVWGWPGIVLSGPDGSFQIAVPPGKGTLLVHGPTLDYVQQVIGDREITAGRPGGTRYYVHSSIPLDLKPDAAPEVATVLRRGLTVHVRLVGPDEKPVPQALMTSPLMVSPLILSWRSEAQAVRNGQFDLHGCSPEKPSPVCILDPKNQIGAMVEVSGQSAGKDLVVRLMPCGSAVMRFVDPQGRPQEGHAVNPHMVLAPGVSRNGMAMRAALLLNQFLGDEDYVANFDRMHYWEGMQMPRSDKQGRCTLPALIPGVTYRFGLDAKLNGKETLDFTVESGKTLQLPDIVVPAESDTNK